MNFDCGRKANIMPEFVLATNKCRQPVILRIVRLSFALVTMAQIGHRFKLVHRIQTGG